MLALLNPQGKTLWRREKQTLWGLLFSNEYRQSNPLNPQMLFAGQYYDEESGLAYTGDGYRNKSFPGISEHYNYGE